MRSPSEGRRPFALKRGLLLTLVFPFGIALAATVTLYFNPQSFKFFNPFTQERQAEISEVEKSKSDEIKAPVTAFAIDASSMLATYTTIANGNWSAASTWAGGVAPGATINAADIVNINHVVTYNLGSDLQVFGTVNITNGTVQTLVGANRSVFVWDGGDWNMCNGVMLLRGSANFNNKNGTLTIYNSTIEIGQDFVDESDAGSGMRTFVGGCVKVGQNFKNKGSVDLFDAVCAEVAISSSGSWENEYRQTFQNSTIIKIVNAGNFINKASVFGGTGSPDLVALSISNGSLTNDGPWGAQVLNFCIGGGSVNGSQATDFNNDVTNNDTPAACAAVNAISCSACPTGTCTLQITASVVDTVSCESGADGSITVTINTGTGTQTCSGDSTSYTWSTSQTTQTLTGLPPGTYTVTVTDASGCSATASVTLIDPDCCILTVICPPSNGGTVQCVEDVPAPDPNLVMIVDSCGNVSITVDADTTGTGCGIDTMVIVHSYFIADSLNLDTCIQIFKVSENTPPVIACPVNITVICAAGVPAPDTTLISASDNCGVVIIEFVSDVSDGMPCTETVTRTYRATDACGYTSECVQVITIDPAPPAAFDAVSPITLTCDEALTFAATDLDYTNNETGACLISGTETGVITGTFDECGGILTQTWTFTDDCNRTISQTQTITIDPAPPAVFDPVSPITLTCDEALTFTATDLDYTNHETGACLISGTETGVITGSFTECGGTLTQTWTFTDDCNRPITQTQTITIDPAPPVVFDPVSPVTLTCDEALTFADTDLDYTNNETGACLISGTETGVITGTFDECGGTLTQTWTFTDDCNRTITQTQTIAIDPAPPAVFDAVSPITLTCDEALTFTATDLDYTNNETGACLISGTETGVITGSFDECGGTLTQTWTFTDDCNRTITQTQTITIDPAPPAVFDPVSPITLTCDEALTFSATDLDYTNNETGACLISGTETGVITGSFTECGGTLTQTWTFTDDCNRTITQTQTITIDPAPPAVFDPVSPITLTCDEALTFSATDLDYTNNETGACLISGTETGVITGSFTECGGTLTQTWTFTDDCNRTITQTQSITIDPAPPAVFDPVSLVALTCDEALTFTATDLDYTNNETGACLISGTETGAITGSFDECGGTLSQTWTFTDDCNRTITQTQTITIDPAPPAVFDPVSPITLTCDEALTFAATDLNYTNNETGACLISGTETGVITGTFDECGGTLTQTWTFTDDCNRTITQTQTITIDPAPPAVFDPVSPVTLTCDEALTFSVTDLDYTNNETGACLISGTETGVITGSFDECGGTLTQTWTFTDDCNRTITQTQTITIDPAPPAVFDPVSPVTLTCDEALTFSVTDLDYTNNETGACLISGTETGVITGSFDECGGTLTQTWTFTDDCNRTITQTQTITIDPAPPAVFDPVSPVTLTCDEAPTFTETDLNYTNNETGACLISGTETGVITGSFDECGGTLTQTWTFTDDCNRTITQTQTITIDPAPTAVFDAVSPVTLTCDEALTFSVTDLDYTNNETGACLISGTETGVITGSFDECGGTLTQTWTFTDDCNRTITQTQTITIEPAPPAVFDLVSPITRTCDEALTFAATDLDYTNNETGACLISGTETGVITGTFDECGGILTQVWTFTDDCNRTISQTQSITIDPAPPAVFDPVSPVTLTCDEALTFTATDLDYTNNETSACLISGTETGVITGTFDECGGILTQVWTFTDDCNRTISQTQSITIDPAPPAVFDPVSPVTLTCDEALTFSVTDLDYTNNETGACLISGTETGVITGTFDECGGTLTQTWTFTDDCNRTITQTQTITIDPAPPAVFDPVSPVTLTCDEAPTFTETDLNYTNNETGACLISGTETGVITGSFDECGGTLTQTWTFTDDCNRTITQTQTITIDPAPPAVFDPVSPVTLTCDEAPTFTETDLNYTNNETGACLISGTETGVITGSFDECGGTLTQTWTFTDDCNRTITQTQTITIDPAPTAVFDAVSPITRTCDEALTFSATDLDYTNNETGACLISGTETGVITGSFDECGGTLTQTWTFTDDCNRTITQTQTITIEPAPPAVFDLVSPITRTCDEALTFSATDLDYTNNETGACLISGTETGVITGTFDECGGILTQVWTFTDDCNRTISQTQSITIDPAPPAVFDPVSPVTLTCDEALTFTATDLNYTNNETGACLISGTETGVITGTFDECGGILTQVWTFTDDCNRTISQTQSITIDPAPPAVFDPVSPVTLTCDEALTFTATDLNYTNNETGACLISGTETGVITGTFDECGGTLTQTWTFTDDCNRTITQTQTITIDPAPPAVFDPVSPVTLTCDEAPTFTETDLNYTNNETGACLISGTETGVITGSFDECGGTLTQTWTFTDDCNRTITQTQTITIDPAPPAVFDPVSPVTLTCDEAPTFTETDLNYTNNETGACLISGTETGVITGSFDECGGTLTQTWTFTDDCNRTITQTQTITIDPAPTAVFDAVSPITLTCDEALTFVVTDLDYTNNETGACLISGTETGVITGTFDECGGTLTQTWTFTDDCNRTITQTQTITIDPAPPAVFDAVSPITLTCDEALTFTATDLDYTNNETSACLISGTETGVITGTFDECGGILTQVWTFTDDCNRTITQTQTITIDPAPPAVFDPVSPVTLTCDEALTFTATDLDYTNNETSACLISGTETGVITGTFDECGGTLTQTWTFTDDCNRTITQTQTITIDPAPPAVFDPVSPVTLTCDEAPTFTETDLNYTNNETGACLISGTETGVITGSFDECGGTLTQTWTFTDDCNRTITQTQTITIDPAPPAVFDPVSPVTLTCDEAPTFTETDLNYTNNETGACLISGTETGVITGSFDECGGTLTQTWTFTDDCNRTISQTQTITIDPAPTAVFDAVSPVTLTCDEALTFSVTDLDYTNNETGACLISGTETGVITGSFDECGGTLTQTWTFTDDCNRTITQTQTITIEPAPPAVFDLVSPITRTCDEALTFSATDLDYTNNETGACLISGTETGVITGTFDECGGTLTQTWTFTDDCNRTITQTQTITIDPAPPAVFDAVSPITLTCDEALTFTATDLDYTNNETSACLISGTETGVITGTFDECGGILTQVWTFTDDCNRTITQTQTITIDPAPPAVFDPVSPITLTCDEALTFVATDLDYTNNETGACLISGTETGVITGSFTECGGTLTQTWTFTDDCNRTITQTQNITIDPAPPAVFDPVSPITLTCDEALTFVATDLDYTNNETGACLISGTETGVITGTFDECGGTLIQTWTFTDDCNRTITQTQNITIDPAPPAVFDPVSPVTLTCDEALTFVATDLDYTNNENGACLISGTETGVITGSFTECGGTLTQVWTFTDDCNRTITQTQTITIDPAPPAVFDAVSPVTLTCDEALTFVATDLDYTNNETGACLISGTETGVITGSFTECGGTLMQTWTFTDDCNRTITQTQTITIDPAPPAAFDAVSPVTLTCDEALTFVATDLDYTNNETGACLISGTETGVITGTFTECGGTLTQVWTFTDDCNRTITQTQTITIDPAPPAVFDAVSPITLTCDEALTFTATDLDYTNNETGACLISGTETGVITGTFDECGGTLTQTWTFTDDCNRTITQTQTITIDPAPPAVFDPVSPITLTCDEALTFSATDLDYTNNETGACLISGTETGVITGSFTECGGTLTQVWTFTDDCNRTITQTQNITIDPAPPAVFDPVSPITLTCDEALTFTATDLDYTNNETGACLISGTETGVITGSFTECGGTLTQTWTFTDDCNRTITQTQNITIDPAPPAVFDPVSPITLTCDEALTFVATDLDYTNGESGACLISGTETGVITGSFTECGGTLTQVWTFTDDCNRTITQTQTITIEPAPPAVLDPVSPITLTCDEALTFVATDLDYTNNETGACLISGTETGVITGSFTECGGTLTQTWTFTDDCNRTITQTQTITIDPAPPAVFDPVSPVTLTCDEALTFSATDLDYTNNETGACLISGTETGVITGTFDECGGTLIQTWIFTDDCNRTITQTQTITIDPAPPAVFDPVSPITLTCDEALTFVATDLDYTNNETGACLISGTETGVITGTFDECGGTLTQTWTFTDDCNRTITQTQTITIDPAPPAVFDAVSPITLTCDEALTFSATDLDYTNNETDACLISGTETGVITGSFTECGGTLTQVWTFTDDCNRTITQTQNITIDPAPPAVFDPVSPITLTCDEALTFVATDLDYTNGESGACLISGTETGVITGSFDECGGTLTQTWTFTDDCNRTITQTQTITIDPAPPAVFDPVSPITLTCDEALTFSATDLDYTNNETGACLISGTETGVITGSFTECGGTLTQTWTFTDDCNRTITQTQTITIDPAPPAVFDPVSPITLTCDEALTFAATDLDYTNNETGACLISGTETGVITGSFTECSGTLTQTWTFTDDCNRTITQTQAITIEPAPPAVFLNPPINVSLSCQELDTFEIPDLIVTNGLTGICGITDTVAPMIDSLPDICGNTSLVTWEYTDECGRTITTSMAISVEPPAIPAFLSPPNDITIQCAEADTLSIPDLLYSNNGAGSCLIEGQVPGNIIGSFDTCGGEFVITWEYTDTCGRIIDHTQTITIQPALAPQFINVPNDTTITCEDAADFVTNAIALVFTNSSACEISGTVQPVVVEDFDACTGTITITWDSSIVCGYVLNHVQTITIEPAPAPQFISIPNDTTLICADAADYLNSVQPLSYTNNETGQCAISGMVNPVVDADATACGGDITVTWMFTDSCGRTIQHVQNISVEPAAEPAFINPPTDLFVSCNTVQSLIYPDLEYSNNAVGACLITGSVQPAVTENYTVCGGDITVTWMFIDSCGRTIQHVQNISVEPATEPAFINPPTDLFVSCNTVQSLIYPDLEYSNNAVGACLITGSVQPAVIENYTVCGGDITVTWMFTDSCGRTIQHVQNISVEPATEPAFINPPTDLFVSCNTVQSLIYPDLEYSNNAVGACLITGSVQPVVTENYTVCDGDITVTWMFTDLCGRTIQHVQNISVEPAPEATFINPPTNETLTCEDAETYSSSSISLDYSNNSSGACVIDGSIIGVIDANFNVCGGVITQTWEYTDLCGRFIQHIQTITVEPAPEASFINPPIDTILDCDTLLLNPVPDLLYSNNSSGSCLIAGTVAGVQTGSGTCGSPITRTWTLTDACGREITHIQNIQVIDNTPPDLMAPLDTVVTCDSNIPPLTDLPWTDNCDGSGTVPGIMNSDGGIDPEIITYTWSYTDACGNTATVMQTITVFELDVVIDPQGPFCSNDSPVTLTATPTGGIWSGDVSGDSFDPNLGPGAFDIIYTYTDPSGCKGADTIVISVNAEVTNPIAESLCSGQFIVINGITYDMPGSYVDTIVGGAASGCDSILNITISPLSAVTTPIDETLCPNESIVINGITYDMPGSYSDTIVGGAASGCDSILIITISPLSAVTTPIDETLCPNESIVINGITYDMPGSYSDTIVGGAASGCDSILNITISPLSAVTAPINEALCPNKSIVINGITYDMPGNYLDTIVGGAASGCDSILNITISPLSAVTTLIDEALCPNQSIVINGITYDMPGNYSDTIVGGAASGCDSILNITISPLSAVTTPINEALCPNQSIVINGITYDMPGSYSDTIVKGAASGCDSILNITISPLSTVTTPINEELCPNQSIVINGITYDMPGNYLDTIVGGTTGGCDSILDISIVSVPAIVTPLEFTLCEGDSIVVNGTTYHEGNPTGADTLIAVSGCDSIVTVTVDFEAVPDAQIATAGPFCLEDGVQTLTATPPGGVWSGAVTTDQFDPASLGSGDHMIIYTATLGLCSDADTVIVTVHPQVMATCAPVQDDSGLMDGIGSVEVTAGTPPFVINWSGPETGNANLNSLGTHTIDGLGAGVYQILVTDANGCTDQCTFTIGLANCTLEIDNVDIINVSCAANVDGAIQITASGGTPPYTYSIDGVSFQSSNVFTNLGGGMFFVFVQDALGCIVDTTINIPVDPDPELMVVAVTSSSCGEANGGIEVSASGGTPPHGFSINGINYQPNGSFSGLAAGIYTLYLLDAKGCTDTTSAIVSDEGAPVIDDIITTNSACGASNGSITILATGGAPPLLYSIGGQSVLSNVFAGLPAGTYPVLVTDQNGCEVASVVQIIDDDSPVIDNTTVTPTACGVNTGTITVTASGGTGSLRYSIDGGPFSMLMMFSNLSSGPHTIVVRDANNCTASIQVIVPTTNGPQINSAPFVHTTCGMDNGQITVNASGGVGTLLFSLNNGPFTTTSVFPDLEAGNYVIEVTDDNDCTDQVVIQINDSEGPTVDAIQEDEHCGNGMGYVILFGLGGVQPYLYSFDGRPYSPNDFYGNLEFGFYDVCVKDDQDCIDCIEIFIDNDDPPRIDSVVVTEATCTQNIGTITVYAWSFFTLQYSINGVFYQSSNLFTGLGPGIYTVYVRDPYGCITTTQVAIEPLTSPTIDNIVVMDEECESPGSLTVISSGGNGMHSYSLDNVIFQSSPVFQGLLAGTYNVFVRDEKDCTDNAPATILGPPVDMTSLVLTICEGDSVVVGTEEFDITGIYTIPLISSLGCDSIVTLTLTVEVCCVPPVELIVDSICEGDSYLLNGVEYQTDGMYTDTIPGGAANGCDSILMLSLSTIPPQESTILATICDGEIFTWGGDSLTQPGIYLDTLMTANGCDSIVTLELTVIAAPLADAGADQTLSCSVAMVMLQGNGTGTPLWTGPGSLIPDNWDQVVDQPGTYILTVTSIDGCIAHDTVQVSVDINTPVADAGPDGFITCIQESVVLTGSANNDNYLFTWSGPGITASQEHQMSPVVQESGIYILIVTDTTTSCVSQPDTVLVTDIRVDVISEIAASGNLDCDRLSVQLSTSGSTTGPGIVYVWLNATGQIAINVPSIHATEPGLYILYAIDTLSGCQAVDSHLVMDITEFPPANAGEDKILDCIVTIVSLEANSTQQLPGLLYSWSGPPGGIVTNPDNRIINAVLAGEYIVQVLDTATGCTTLDTVLVIDERDHPNAEAGPSQIIECLDEVVMLDGSQSSSGPEYDYLWNGPGVVNVQTVSIQVDLPGWYELSVMNMGTGCEDVDSTEVQMADFLTGAEIAVWDPTCFGDSSGQVIIGTPVGGMPPYQYSLGGVVFDSIATFNGLPAGTYVVIIRDQIGCEWETLVTVNEGPVFSLDIGPDLDLFFGDSVQLQAIILPPGLVDSISWTPPDMLSCVHCFDPLLTANSLVPFVVSATAYIGNCNATDSLLVHVNDDYTIFVPNVFSPNDDNANDFVTVYSNDERATVLEFEIFDRWGEKVFRSTYFPVNVLELGWDGVFREKEMNPAVFVFVAKVQFRNGVIRTVSGDVTLLR